MKNYKPIIDFLFPASRELKLPRITLHHKPGEDYGDKFKGHSAMLSITYQFHNDMAEVAIASRTGHDLVVGHIRFDGAYHILKPLSDLEQSMIDSLNTGVIKTLRMYGRKGGSCCICRTALDDPRSLSVGYGPVCANKWALPWTKAEVAKYEYNHDVDWDLVHEINELNADDSGDDGD